MKYSITYYYSQLSEEELSLDDLKVMLVQLDKVEFTPLHDKYTLSDVYNAMLEQPNADEEFTGKVIDKLLGKNPFVHQGVYKTLDKGTKKSFDAVWDKHSHLPDLWKSIHTDEKQLEQVWKNYFERSGASSMDAFGLQSFCKHPNAPDTILSNSLIAGRLPLLLELASNPNIESKPKTFKIICEKVRNHTNNGTLIDDILKQLLNNTNISWDSLATAIDIKDQLDHVFDIDSNGRLKTSNPFREQLIFDFCKRPECTAEIKIYMYELSNDPSFLPQEARDIFLF